ncbi:cytochrome P450 2G1-like [Haliotis rubra]|uniref:cytochrome P450 2G1-like n=1 Tax=Haliotis rubra TaxID=36100 RepID=UPI001EE5FC7D|nr:cytochrome P450 2G1-like [Haliotis rubra]
MVDIFTFSPTTLLLCVAVLVLLWLLTRRPSGLPPGPPLLPFVGNVLSMGSDPRITFRKLRQQYGDIFSVYMFNTPVIVLNGYSTLRDAIVKRADVFSHRPHTTLTDFISKGKGVAGTSGDLWPEQRRFTLNTLREFGAGRNIMEDKIQLKSHSLSRPLRQNEVKGLTAHVWCITQYPMSSALLFSESDLNIQTQFLLNF